MNETIKHLPNGDFEAKREPVLNYEIKTPHQLLENLIFYSDKIQSIVDKHPGAIGLIIDDKNKISFFVDIDLLDF